MRKAFFILLLSAYSLQPTAFSQSVIRVLPWEVDTARPAIKEWALVRGETVDLECRYLSGASAMDVRGAAVVLHCRTNGMPADLSFQVTGSVGRASSTNLASVGWVTVRVRPDLDLPPDARTCTFALETTLNSARNLVATGLLRLSGDPTGASPAALPVFQYDAKGSAQAVSNALASALQQVSDSIASIPPPSTDAQRLSYSGSIFDATGGVWRVFYPDAVWTLSAPEIGFSTNVTGLVYPLPEGSFTTNWMNGNLVLLCYGYDGVQGNRRDVTLYYYGSSPAKLWSITASVTNQSVTLPPTLPAATSNAYLTCVPGLAITSHVDSVVYRSVMDARFAALPPVTTNFDATRLINTNASEWIDADGSKWRVQHNSGWTLTVPDFPDASGPVAELTSPLPETFERIAATGELYISVFGPPNAALIEFLIGETYWSGIYTNYNLATYTLAHDGGTYADCVLEYSSSVTTTRVDSVVFETTKNLHRDSYTNLIWQEVISNGWPMLRAYTNTP